MSNESEEKKKIVSTFVWHVLYECFIDVGHLSKEYWKMIFVDPDLSYPTCVVKVSFKCQTPTHIEHYNIPNHRGVCAS
jgi:hypothetical protein